MSPEILDDKLKKRLENIQYDQTNTKMYTPNIGVVMQKHSPTTQKSDLKMHKYQKANSIIQKY